AIARDEAVDEAQRAAVEELLAWYEVEYAKTSAGLETFCIEWDDGVQSGVSHHRTQHLAAALQPLIEERSTLSRTILQHCEAIVGRDVIQRLRRTRSTTRTG